MKAVFLDYATMGPDLNLEPLSRFFSAFKTFDETNDADIAERIRGAEFVFTNKFKMTLPLLGAAKELRRSCAGAALAMTNQAPIICLAH